ncbi:PcfJ domain-containing protein [Marinobacter shengliensis]
MCKNNATKISKDDTSAGENVDIEINFQPSLDCKVKLSISDNNINIIIEAYGNVENEIDPGFAIFTNNQESIHDHLIGKLPKSISNEALNKLVKLKYLQLTAIKSCAESNRAQQMILSNEALFWIVLDRINSESCYSKNLLERIFGLKRKKLTALTLNSEKQRTVKFLEKIVTLNGERNELDLIKKKARNDLTISKFKHWDTIPIQALYIDERYPKLSSSKIAWNWCKKDHQRMSDFTRRLSNVDRLFEDTIEMGNRLNIKNARNMLMQCENEEKLKLLHDHWVALTVRSNTKFDPDIIFKDPNIGTPSWLERIESANQLIEEGKEMEHCIGTYVNKAITGKSLLFRVHLEERATMELKRRGAKLEIVEIKKHKNQCVSDKTRDAIHRWLHRKNQESE